MNKTTRRALTLTGCRAPIRAPTCCAGRGFDLIHQTSHLLNESRDIFLHFVNLYIVRSQSYPVLRICSKTNLHIVSYLRRDSVASLRLPRSLLREYLRILIWNLSVINANVFLLSYFIKLKCFQMRRNIWSGGILALTFECSSRWRRSTQNCRKRCVAHIFTNTSFYENSFLWALAML